MRVCHRRTPERKPMTKLRNFVQRLFGFQPLLNEITTNNRACPPDATAAMHVYTEPSSIRAADGAEYCPHGGHRRNIYVSNSNSCISGFQTALGCQLRQQLIVRGDLIPS